MNARLSVVVLGSAALLALLVAVAVQQSQLVSLRAEQQALVTISTAGDSSLPAAADAGSQDVKSASASPPMELLQLRSQVSQLMQRQREMEFERAENERLRGLASARATNTVARSLPPDYILKRQAQWVGMNTPENTLQSFLWTLNTTNLATLLQLMTPRTASVITQKMGDAPLEFFHAASMLPGMRIVSRRQMPDGSVQATVEMAPGQPIPEPITFRLIDGQWKMDLDLR